MWSKNVNTNLRESGSLLYEKKKNNMRVSTDNFSSHFGFRHGTPIVRLFQQPALTYSISLFLYKLKEFFLDFIFLRRPNVRPEAMRPAHCLTGPPQKKCSSFK